MMADDDCVPIGVGMAERNLKIYERRATAHWYGQRSGLTLAEEAVLAFTQEDWRDRDVLDLGVGGGRTSVHLSAEARTYCGVDFSAEMVKVARARHPNLSFLRSDVRDLSALGDASIDFAFFSDNGIDTLDDAGRAAALREVSRVLRPGGAFVVSGHNLDCRPNQHVLLDILRMRLSPSPVATLRAFARIPIRAMNYARSLGAAVRTERYAILRDPGNDYASPHYYAGAVEMRRQLTAAGLDLIAIFDEDGRRLSEQRDTRSAALHYVSRRLA